ncbi:MAG: helix-turn-helix domain-containing protein [Deltaproteobacteria bacterium]|nr:helix-turn-helix domain-containing protein [Deltaproteobacteria bacterium]
MAPDRATGWLDVKQVAERFGVSRTTAYRWIVAFMPHLRVGRVVRVTERTLEEFARRFTEVRSCRSSSGPRAGRSGRPSSDCPTAGGCGAPPDAPTDAPQKLELVRSSVTWPKPVMPRTKPTRSATPSPTSSPTASGSDVPQAR